MAAELNVRPNLAKATGVRLSKPDWSRPEVIQELPIDIICTAENNPRRFISGRLLRNMIEDVKAEGVKEPLSICRGPNDEPYLFSGHRRLLSARQAGQTHVPCLLRPKRMNPRELDKALIGGNLHRADIAPIDQAKAYREYMDKYGLNQTELAREFNTTQSEISQSLKLLGLPEEVHVHVNSGAIPRTRALELLDLPESRRVSGAAILMAGGSLAKASAPSHHKSIRAGLARVTANGPGLILGADLTFHCTGNVVVKVQSVQRGKTKQDIVAALEEALEQAKKRLRK